MTPFAPASALLAFPQSRTVLILAVLILVAALLYSSVGQGEHQDTWRLWRWLASPGRNEADGS